MNGWAARGTGPGGQLIWLHTSSNRRFVEACADRGQAIIAVTVRERQPADPPSPYWGWEETGTPGEYVFVWPRRIQFEMCFTYGPKAEEERGKGRAVNLIVEPMQSTSNPGT